MQKIIHEHRRSGLSYEAELELLAEVYRLALESYRKRKNEEGGCATSPIRPEGERDKEVSHVDHSSVEPPGIVNPQFAKEKEQWK